MSERIFIKPVPQPDGQPALKVRKPVNGHLASEGEWVNLDSYWQRRLNDGDVVLADQPATPTLPTTKEKASKALPDAST